MHSSVSIWQAPAGLAIFMLGMHFMETALSRLSGRSFKLFLKKYTSNSFLAILAGCLVTSILQSSSVVNLLVLALTGSGVLQMQNALAVILGANLGTTLTTWIIATLGFSVEIFSFALPLIAIGGISFVLSERESKLYTWSRFILGLGLLFAGLVFIREGILEYVKQFDLSILNQYPDALFLLAGFMLTALIQSSSATMAIVLSALFAGAITLETSLILVLGSEVGTATKLMLASAGGLPIKKRVALGSLLFNIIPALLIFFFLSPVISLLQWLLPETNELIFLAFFQSFINIIGIIIFLPLLKRLSKFLQSLYTAPSHHAVFLSRLIIREEDIALEAFRSETLHLLHDSIDYMASCLGEGPGIVQPEKMHPAYRERNLSRKYEFIKEMHGHMREYFVLIRQNLENKDLESELDRLMTSARNCMYAAKSMKDELNDIHQLSNSSNNIKYGFFREETENTLNFCRRMVELLEKEENTTTEELGALYNTLSIDYSRHLQHLYKQSTVKDLNDTEVSTLINFNRELATAHKSLFFALRDYLPDSVRTAELENLPGFIR